MLESLSYTIEGINHHQNGNFKRWFPVYAVPMDLQFLPMIKLTNATIYWNGNRAVYPKMVLYEDRDAKAHHRASCDDVHGQRFIRRHTTTVKQFIVDFKKFKRMRHLRRLVVLIGQVYENEDDVRCFALWLTRRGNSWSAKGVSGLNLPVLNETFYANRIAEEISNAAGIRVVQMAARQNMLPPRVNSSVFIACRFMRRFVRLIPIRNAMEVLEMQ